MPKTNGKKSRQSPSVERQLALALVAIIEVVPGGNLDDPGIAERQAAIINAKKILKDAGYEGLESTPTRVKRIQAEIAKALADKNYDALAKLGQEMKRAEAGKPPLATEKKPRKKKVEPTTARPPTEPAERKTRKRREAVDGVMCKCGNVDCDWAGISTVGSACPVDGYLVVAQEG